MSIWTESSFIHDADTLVPKCGTGVSSLTCVAGRLARKVQAGYAPDHGPGAATSGSSSTLVSNSLKPRRW